MRITRNQLRQLIREALEIHHAPEDLDRMGPEEAYGMGYLKGQDMQCDHPDWSPACVQNDSHTDDPDLDDDGSLSVAELVNMVHRIVDDIDMPQDHSNASTNLQRTFEKEAQAKSAALSSASTLAKSLEGSGTRIDDWLLGRVYAALLRMSRLLQGRTISGKYKDALGAFQISEGKMKITRRRLQQVILEVMGIDKDSDGSLSPGEIRSLADDIEAEEPQINLRLVNNVMDYIEDHYMKARFDGRYIIGIAPATGPDGRPTQDIKKFDASVSRKTLMTNVRNWLGY